MVVLKSSYEKCQGCGGNLKFNPATQSLICKKCGAVEEFEKTKEASKHSIYNDTSKESHQKWLAENKVIQCANCSAKIVLNNLEYAASCPYCGSEFVSVSENLPGISPDKIIPFMFDEEEAVKRFKNSVKKKFYVPRPFKKNVVADNVKGIYIPSFAFDVNTSSSYNGTLSRTVRYVRNGKSYSRQEHFPISGKINLLHQDVMVESSSKINQNQLSEILPYNNKDCYDFDENFIRGYGVEHYELDVKDCYSEAKKIINANIRRSILSKYSYNSVVRLEINTQYSNEVFLYKVSPIYKFNYVYKGKNYTTLMNGQTGKLGKGLPKSKIKVAFTVIGVILIIAAIILAIALL